MFAGIRLFRSNSNFYTIPRFIFSSIYSSIRQIHKVVCVKAGYRKSGVVTYVWQTIIRLGLHLNFQSPLFNIYPQNYLATRYHQLEIESHVRIQKTLINIKFTRLYCNIKMLFILLFRKEL